MDVDVSTTTPGAAGAWAPARSFRFEGREIRYGVTGSGPPLVLVHGTPWSSFNLRHLITGLARDFRVHYWDLLGFGQSDKAPGDVSLAVHNRALAALLDHWELERPFIIGHDAQVQPFYDLICRPVLILWGREDAWVPLERGYELQRLIPDSELVVIDDAGHLVIEEKPQALISRIANFLGRP